MIIMIRAAQAIRRARPGDGPGMARVHIAAWRAAYVGIMTPDRLDALSERTFTRRWESVVADPGEARPFVGEITGEIAAIAAVGPPRLPMPAGVGELRMINVHPDHWGTGLARLLHDRLLDELRSLDYTSAYLWVAEKNARAIAFYRRLGWTPDGEIMDDDRDHPPIRELRYIRPL
ncbi:GNAT family N-acetyltransferase [Actinokineospora enzanensis]|uniref:GNAT family N-acetyltransferase n=1 Tax=Actinokineospora enzanensis TaxID=155975 RepID=UPI000360290E|nr:GNAT family N-acetyltransferase [Actinokineospora enzanensis]